jgi:hypothetical protein
MVHNHCEQFWFLQGPRAGKNRNKKQEHWRTIRSITKEQGSGEGWGRTIEAYEGGEEQCAVGDLGR